MFAPVHTQTAQWWTSRSYQTTGDCEDTAKWSAYHIPSEIVVFVVLVCKSHSQKSQEALNPQVTEERYWALFYMPLYKFFTQFADYTGTDCKQNEITEISNSFRGLLCNAVSHKTTQRWAVAWQINIQGRGLLEVLSQYLPEKKLRKHTKTLSQDIRGPGRDSNLAASEYDSYKSVTATLTRPVYLLSRNKVVFLTLFISNQNYSDSIS
jgi:hypothetical protein